eukprot:CAMPEP_0178955152 /NCGR_PEP_ID=MMETSP0789-20121207/9432_1 /TAXON_ID=3005 /ORGANISM="Rhizosolenia setigera, Strain CCMP 1694" /LENGTH=97 /DNA_ID=CAMNT_0020636723 /DNA_START=47 /DNA_END=340 /DNA_ORIENTATION=+
MKTFQAAVFFLLQIPLIAASSSDARKERVLQGTDNYLCNVVPVCATGYVCNANGVCEVDTSTPVTAPVGVPDFTLCDATTTCLATSACTNGVCRPTS